MGYFLWVINMNKEYITIVSTKVGIDCNRPDLVGKSIVIYDNDKKHCYKRHYSEFENPRDFSFIMKNLDYVINQCDFVLYNDKNNSLEYYKKLKNNISIRVKVENSKELKIKTFFILSDEKYELKRNRMAYNKYVIHE